MLKREIKINLKSFIIWTLVLIGIFSVAYLMYPSIIESNGIEQMDEMMQMFPESVLKAFNMDISSMETAFGWLKSEGFVFVLLIINSYAAIIGSNILLKEESDKTIEYLNSLPVTRSKIVLSKFLAGLFYIVLITLVVGVFNYVALTLSGDFDKKVLIYLSMTPLLSSITLYTICMFISTFTHKTKKMFGIGIGLVFISYMLNVLSTMAESSEFLKYLSVFTLADIRNVIVNSSIDIKMVLISVVLSVLFLIATLIRYNKKDLV